MLVLIEGNEGVGKTILIEQLSSRLRFITAKYPAGHFAQLERTLESFVYSDDLFVLDRGFVSDMVYRIRDKKRGQTSLAFIANLCESGLVKIVFCDNPGGYKNAMERGETNVVLKKDHDDITATFNKIKQLLTSFTNIQIMSYDYSVQNVDDVVNFIKEDK